ncbi:transcriptional regulator, LacI family [Xylanimonas cellulosilytica DSM 15894]|uniref:Transcriptional regulator, LacI family n=1 Tax=Xylanimonas cellulosilytica (strain DSM 15894 / JCM 12276 / CECT 5975 / KCTC 9989 / LMG 20990 / NBRC 107835 / XIL07) TaxID=446471 RepID=D1BVD4_XYLCX|nr:LacI family DNA-binding transcriptional regulator [Xylanimonas cellulosilytica]ACZ29405.1 transcriptional regulator, LacI family [Xylanimonas cellulosilytica DSM 15894]
MTSVTREPSPDRGATIAQIAHEIGVSVPTVSKVLNGRSDVAAETRARVEDALERHHYRRRKAAPPPAGAGLIDLVFHRIGSSWSMEIIRGVEDAAAAARMSVILSELGGVHRPPRAWLDATLLRPPRGVVMVASRLSPAQQRQLAHRSIPVVVIDTDGEPPPDVPTVGSDNWNGGLIATRHLLALGHRRIAAVSGPADMLCSHARLDGFRTAHAEAGATVDDDLILPGNFYVESGYRAGHELLTRRQRPTAIFAGSDMAALGVLRAAHELGLVVPRDVSVVGYDDLSLAQWAHPALTTVRQPLAEMGSMATGMLVDLVEGRQPQTRRINLATELVVRESTAEPA